MVALREIVANTDVNNPCLIFDKNDDMFLMPDEKERIKEYCNLHEGVKYKSFRSKLRTMGMKDYEHHMKNRNIW